VIDEEDRGLVYDVQTLVSRRSALGLFGGVTSGAAGAGPAGRPGSGRPAAGTRADRRWDDRSGLIACVYRAAEWRHKKVELAAHELLQRLDEVAGIS
jgi:hypothetical protein